MSNNFTAELKTCNILGVDINVTNMRDTIDIITKNLEYIKGDYICVSNVHTTVMSYEDDMYRDIQNGGFMALPDGKPLSIVAKRRGFKNAERVTGPDLMEEMFKNSEKKGYTHYFYGSTEDTLSTLKVELNKKYPKLKVVGMYSPPFRKLTEEEDKEIIENINKVEPSFIWVGLGAPKQEVWMSDHKCKVNGLMIGVGAGFDYHAGNITRAPKWMQNMSLEWLYRLLQDPKRLFKRYINTNFKFILLNMKNLRK
ncbi:WecB/TagA/CpsF family glycosyltransferase [Paraclostridium bifermentans]|uniref:WecB/TagA/CpsF family glycosyltransferase n=1 Tax=Paraclostridium bifermentans TaxID=1490 RepID=UPI001C80B765|nr:WecB/TagA/CpsF family glycosyltransferase [Paraclostridium bifermentans]GIM33802.1 glycosyl transferase [Paraclostridium bifermentans subsp. muricolitidis]